MGTLASTAAPKIKSAEPARGSSQQRPQARGRVVTDPYAELLNLQRTIGNRTVVQLLQRNKGSTQTEVLQPASVVHRQASVAEGVCPICGRRGRGLCPGCGRPLVMSRQTMLHAKLTVNAPGDWFEQEADRVADQVMRTPKAQDTIGQPASTQGQQDRIQRLCNKECDEQLHLHLRTENGQAPLQLKEMSGAAHYITKDLHSEINALRGAGQPLPVRPRAFFERRLGVNLSRVRVHTDDRAAQTARALNARAFTFGRDVVFASGQYAPETPAGQKLLAHELAHVVQQGGGTVAAHAETTGSPTTRPNQAAFAPGSPAISGAQRAAVQRDEAPTPTPSIGATVADYWLPLPDFVKATVIDKVIDLAIGTVEDFPGKDIIGPLWVFFKEGLLGFYGKLRSTAQNVKIRVMDKIAKIIAGKDKAFTLAFLKGLLKGFFVDGALGIFIAIWDLIKGLKGVWDFLKGIGQSIGGFPEEIRKLVENLENVGQELAGNIGPAIDEAKKLFTDPSQGRSLAALIVEKAAAFAKQGGEKIAESLLNFFSKPEASAEVGETVGDIIGMGLWEVVFALLTAGGGAVVTTVKEAAGTLGRILAKVAGVVLKVVEEIRLLFGKVVDVVKSAVNFLKGKLRELGGRLAELLEGVGKFLARLLDNCHESKLVCKFAKTVSVHPNLRKTADVLRREARAAFLQVYPRFKGKLIEVHHRIPLEWSDRFPLADPNRLSNLQGLTKPDHLRKASDMWDAFRNTYRRAKRGPTAAEVLEHAMLVDRSLELPYPL